jgi:hypothetical protein
MVDAEELQEETIHFIEVVYDLDDHQRYYLNTKSGREFFLTAKDNKLELIEIPEPRESKNDRLKKQETK